MERIDRRFLVIGGIFATILLIVVIILVVGGKGSAGAGNGSNVPEATLTLTPGGKVEDEVQTLGAWLADNPDFQTILYSDKEFYQALGLSDYCYHISAGETEEDIVEFYNLEGDRLEAFREANITHYHYDQEWDGIKWTYTWHEYMPSTGILLGIPGPCRQLVYSDLQGPVPSEFSVQPTISAPIPSNTPVPTVLPIQIVPVCTQFTHVVERGENLFRIGLPFGLTGEEVAVQNGITNPELIYPDQQLTILVCN